ncbi:hypothetical protein BDP27DRAFT_1449895 [Rhodocollybia butyracea]|uniref:Uncharacterized protein n=1 Tax=Rhodocollybia butyracea TaxID=206335 RepID=A0A9P5U3Z0_9AGAR|nr:hypothetical protein BDP27DRAFT_1449895 [Rhodocollybia butyracea]
MPSSPSSSISVVRQLLKDWFSIDNDSDIISVFGFAVLSALIVFTVFLGAMLALLFTSLNSWMYRTVIISVLLIFSSGDRSNTPASVTEAKRAYYGQSLRNSRVAGSQSPRRFRSQSHYVKGGPSTSDAFV